jgi:hypothetical protein
MADAEPPPAPPPATSVRVATAANKYSHTRQFAVARRRKAECAWSQLRVELAAGAIHSPDATRPFASAGPVWCGPLRATGLFLEMSISPTLIAGSRIDGRNLGGDFQFTSSAALGTHFGRRRAWSAALRFQHMSNAGLNRPNPGLNLIGLDFVFRPGER